MRIGKFKMKAVTMATTINKVLMIISSKFDHAELIGNPHFDNYGRPGCFPAIVGIPAITKLGDFPAKEFEKYSRWPRGTVAGYEGWLPAYHRA